MKDNVLRIKDLKCPNDVRHATGLYWAIWSFFQSSDGQVILSNHQISAEYAMHRAIHKLLHHVPPPCVPSGDTEMKNLVQRIRLQFRRLSDSVTKANRQRQASRAKHFSHIFQKVFCSEQYQTPSVFPLKLRSENCFCHWMRKSAKRLSET